MATRPLPAKKLLRCARGRHRGNCKGDKDKRHLKPVRQRCTVRGHVYGCGGPSDPRHAPRASRSEAARQREASRRAKQSEPMDEATREAVRGRDSGSKAAARMRRFRARQRAKEIADPVTFSGKRAYPVGSVGSVTLSAPIPRSAEGGTKPLSAIRAIPVERLPKALQPFAGKDCPCPCHGWPTGSLITEHQAHAIPAPRSPEPPERRRLINEAKAMMCVVYDPERILRDLARRRGQIPAPEPERVQFGHRADCTAWVLNVRPEDAGWTDAVAAIQSEVFDEGAFRRALSLSAGGEQQ